MLIFFSSFVFLVIIRSTLCLIFLSHPQLFDHASSDFERDVFYISNAYLHIHLISAAVDIISYRRSQQKSPLNYDYEKHNRKPYEKKHLTQNSDQDENSTNVNMNDCPSFLDFTSYCMYFPVIIYGPILTFDQFHLRRKAFFRSKGKIIHSVQNIVISAIRIVFWFCALELLAHFMYPNSMALNIPVVFRLSTGGMIGFIMWQSLYFLMKYICFFGVGSLACKLEGLEPPPSPRCTATLYRYTDVWKYFDTGYYNFIKHYIYIPIGGSWCGFLRQSLASVTAFAFIYFWHGTTFEIFLWAAGNWSVIALELMFIQLLKTSKGSSLVSSNKCQNVNALLAFQKSDFKQ